MSIVTKFLKLVKPEVNDYVNVEEHISKNYDRLDDWAAKVDKDVVKKANIANDLITVEEGSVLDARQGKKLNDEKFDKTGGNITGNVVIQQNLVVNTSISTNTFILGGYKIVIE